MEHFLLDCTLYKKDREILLERNDWGDTTRKKLFRLFTGNTQCQENADALLAYIRKTYNKRNKIKNKKTINEEHWLPCTIN